MAVLAFVRPDSAGIPQPAGFPGREEFGQSENRLRLYGRVMRLCFIFVLIMWVTLQIGCLLSLFLHFRSGIVAGTIDGTIAFRVWPRIDGLYPDRALTDMFVPHVFPLRIAAGYAMVLTIASLPFCASLLYLARLFDLYAQSEVFTQRTATVMRRIAHSVLVTGYSPLLLGPVAHAIGVLKPITGVTKGMIAFVLVGLVLLAISHVMEIGQRMRQDQEEIL